jgi:hypothetical protein
MNEQISLNGVPIIGFGAANPASENCVAKGGVSKITQLLNGDQGGLCEFPDGSFCEEWALFRGTCAPGDTKKLHVFRLLAVPTTGAAIGGLVGYGIKKNAHGATVGALVGAATPFVLAGALIASGWTP